MKKRRSCSSCIILRLGIGYLKFWLWWLSFLSWGSSLAAAAYALLVVPPRRSIVPQPSSSSIQSVYVGRDRPSLYYISRPWRNYRGRSCSTSVVAAAAAVTTTNGASSTTATPITTTPTPITTPIRTGNRTNTSTRTATTTTDARQIIATGLGRRYTEAVRLRHILFASADLAQHTLDMLRHGHHQATMETLAMQVSACSYTRSHGGSIGWIFLEDPVVPVAETVAATEADIADNNNNQEEEKMNADDRNAHLDDVLPRAARHQVVAMTTKPGDIVMVESARGYHLIQIEDVLQNVRKMALVKKKPAAQSVGKSSSSTLNATKMTSTGFPAVTDNSATAALFGYSGSSSSKIRSYQLETMGCQMNQADSERIAGQLEQIGYIPFQKDYHNKRHHQDQDQDQDQYQDPYPNIVVLNTCSIRDHAEQKVYSYLGPHAKRKRLGNDVTIVVAGCVAQHTGRDLLRRAPEVDLVMGPQYANRLADLLEEVFLGNQVVATEATHIMEDTTKPRRSSTTVAWVNVIYGCNERCSFCIVPFTRGVEQSRPPESIVKEVKTLVENEGYREVALLGQNIDAYGRDMIPKRKFSDLIRKIGDEVPDLKRLRFVTSHPRYMSMGVVDAVAETPVACESFHIPFQSGNNQILARMGRGYTREKFLRIVERIRSKIPDAAITADVIVGFPGETEEQFLDSCRLMEEVIFDSVNTAAYSPRPNTPAAIWVDQIPEHVKQDRLQRINELNKRHAAQRRARMIGRVEEVLVEERNIKIPAQVMGRTRHGYIVYCEGDIDLLRGSLVSVLIESTHTYHLVGRIVSGKQTLGA